jgi:hypothetical protein
MYPGSTSTKLVLELKRSMGECVKLEAKNISKIFGTTVAIELQKIVVHHIFIHIFFCKQTIRSLT